MKKIALILLAIISTFLLNAQVNDYELGTNKFKGIELEGGKVFILLKTNGDGIIVINQPKKYKATRKSFDYQTKPNIICRYCGKQIENIKFSNDNKDYIFIPNGNIFNGSIFRPIGDNSFYFNSYGDGDCPSRRFNNHVYIDSCVPQFDLGRTWLYQDFVEAIDSSKLKIEIGNEIIYAKYIKTEESFEIIEGKNSISKYKPFKMGFNDKVNRILFTKCGVCLSSEFYNNDEEVIFIYNVSSTQFSKFSSLNIKKIEISGFSWEPVKNESFDFNINKTVDLSYKSSKDIKKLFLFKSKSQTIQK